MLMAMCAAGGWTRKIKAENWVAPGGCLDLPVIPLPDKITSWVLGAHCDGFVIEVTGSFIVTCDPKK